jgi:hypothetical protein
MFLIDKYRAKIADARRQADLSDLTEEERFIFEERAAIMEFDGGLTRVLAECEARAYILNRRRGVDDKI